MDYERHFFPGSNSGQGFFGRFDQILPYSDARRIYLLKGGPGVGKSNFMRRAVERLSGQFVPEYFHCSSDPDSLDAVAFKEIGVVMIDATAPHTLDPVIPCAVDNIVNLGDFLDAKAMIGKRGEITRLLSDVRFCFERTYRYLGACRQLRTDSEQVMLRSLNQNALKEQIGLLFRNVFMTGSSGKNGTSSTGERKLFLEAITPQGVVSYLRSMQMDRVIKLDAPWGLKADMLLTPLRDEALRLGFFVEGYYDPLEPAYLSHLAIPEMSVIITSGSLENAEHVVPMLSLLDAEALATEGAALRWNHHTYDNLEAKAIESLRKEKILHDELESYYTANMDFCAWQNIFDKTMKEIIDLCVNA